MIKTGKATGSITERIVLDGLNTNSVSIERQMLYTSNGQHLPMGEPHRRAFINSSKERQALQAYDIPKNYIQAVFDVWGKTPVIEDISDEIPEEQN